tara:strand:- start:4570 stop:6024 length:1455 start_codon:yes stop_codon:yes gene_type:complete
MHLKQLLNKVDVISVHGNQDIKVNNIEFNSKKISHNDLFVAIKGEKFDGHIFINDAISNGAIAIVVSELPNRLYKDKTYIVVNDTALCLPFLAKNFFKDISRSIKLIGVTGTNGKTSIVSLLYQLFTLMGEKSGMLSTVQNKIGSLTLDSTHTTPDILTTYRLLKKMIDEKCKYCFMEVSSHALDQYRVKGLHFDVAIFTNLTHDHLDYHKKFSIYRDIKKSFFDSLDDVAIAILNKDDKNSKKMGESTKANKLYYSLKTLSDYNCKIIEYDFEGTLIKINNQDLWIKLVGEYNVYNVLAVFAVAKQLGFSEKRLLRYVSMLDSPKGRFQIVRSSNKITGIVDYAHTPDALENILKVINKINFKKSKVITIIGCGGNRDIDKRPKMAKVACTLSSNVILTNDNPRNEDPKKIISQMMKGVSKIELEKVIVIEDRLQAIKTAYTLANSNDIILLAGKGHEKYQQLKNEKIEFDDFKELKLLLKEK